MKFNQSKRVCVEKCVLEAVLLAFLILGFRMAMMKVTSVSKIVCGKIEFQARASVIHLWLILDRNNSSEEGSIHMILLDEKVISLNKKKYHICLMR